MTIEYVHRCFLDWLPEFYKKHDVPLLERPAAIKLTYFGRFFGRHWKHEQGAMIQLLHKGECPPPPPLRVTFAHDIISCPARRR